MAIDPATLAALQQQLALLNPGQTLLPPEQQLLVPQAPGAPPPVVPPVPPLGPVGPTPPLGPLAPPAETPQMPPPPQPQLPPAEQGALVPAPQMPPFVPPGPDVMPGGGPMPAGQPGMEPGAPQPGQPPPSPQEQALSEQITAEAELQRATDAEDDTLGEGARPRRRSTLKHPLEMAAEQIAGELQMNSKRLAADLFPNGPAGTVQPSRSALGAYMRRHWDDPQFRQVMLDRMAPKGPDGNRVPWGVRNFLRLYEDHVAPYRLPHRVSGIVQPNLPAPPQPQPPEAPATLNEAMQPPMLPGA